jgi:hypothetical protein
MRLMLCELVIVIVSHTIHFIAPLTMEVNTLAAFPISLTLRIRTCTVFGVTMIHANYLLLLFSVLLVPCHNHFFLQVNSKSCK